jgi:hypothetical protein
MSGLTPLTPEGMREAGLRAIRKAEEAEARANRRAEEISAEALRHLQSRAHSALPRLKRIRTRVEDVPVDPRLHKAVASAWTSEDAKFRLAVGDNRWYLDQAAAYGANSGQWTNV